MTSSTTVAGVAFALVGGAALLLLIRRDPNAQAKKLLQPASDAKGAADRAQRTQAEWDSAVDAWSKSVNDQAARAAAQAQQDADAGTANDAPDAALQQILADARRETKEQP